MKKAMAVLVLLTFVALGCNQAPPEPPQKAPPPPPPPPSADELYSEAMTQLGQVLIPTNCENKQAVQGAVKQVQSKLRSQLNGDAAMLRIANEIQEQQKAAFENENWDMVLTLGHAVEIFYPDSSRAKMYHSRALAEKRRPKVNLKGFAEDEENDVTYALLEVYDPETKKTEHMQVRPGEEFKGLRFDKIIGRNSGIVYTYLETGQKYEETRD